jgi:hypothetical protein
VTGLHVALLPAHLPSRDVLPPTDPISGVVTFTARPTRHAWPISQDLLAALGVNLDLYGSGRRHREDLHVAQAWLLAHQVHSIIIRHADHLPDNVLIDDLRSLCEQVHARLVLTCDDSGGQSLIDYAQDRGHDALLPLDALHRLLAEQARPIPEVFRGQEAAFPVHVPKADFPTFLHLCQAALTAEDFAAVTAVYWSTFHTVREAAPADKHAAATLLHSLIQDRSGPAEVTVIVRAAQAAMFTLAQQLKVEMQALLVSVADETHRRLTLPEIRSLRAYRQPWRSTAIVLTDADLSQNDIQALTVQDVTTDGRLRQGKVLLHPEATVYLRAIRHLRLLDGAAPDDPLLNIDSRNITYTLRRAGIELNLPALGDHVRAFERRRDRWANSVGVTLQPLTGPLNPTKAS